MFRSSFKEFQAKHEKDERFQAVEKSKDRENMFSDFVGELRKKEKAERAVQREKVMFVSYFRLGFVRLRFLASRLGLSPFPNLILGGVGRGCVFLIDTSLVLKAIVILVEFVPR